MLYVIRILTRLDAFLVSGAEVWVLSLQRLQPALGERICLVRPRNEQGIVNWSIQSLAYDYCCYSGSASYQVLSPFQVYFKQFCRTCQKSFNPYRVEDITCQVKDLGFCTICC